MGKHRLGYVPPVPLGELTNRRRGTTTAISYFNKNEGGWQVIVGISFPDCDDIVVDERSEYIYLRKLGGKWFRFDNIYALWRYLAHQRRKYARQEIPNLQEMITNIDGMNAEAVKVRTSTLKTAWSRALRRRFEAERRKLLNVKDPLKQRALKYLTYVVQPGELSLDEDPDGNFCIDSLGRPNGGPLGTDSAAAARPLRQRVYVIHRRLIESAIIEAYVNELIGELEQYRDETIEIWWEFCGLAEFYIGEPEEAFEREIYYLLNRLQWLLARLWLSPYDRAAQHINGEIGAIRVIIENDRGKYRRGEVSREDWRSVLEMAETIFASLELQKVRGSTERLLLPLAEGEEGGLSQVESEAVGSEMNKFISQLEKIDDSGFQNPKMPGVLLRFRAAREDVRRGDFKAARKRIKELVVRDAHLI